MLRGLVSSSNDGSSLSAPDDKARRLSLPFKLEQDTVWLLFLFTRIELGRPKQVRKSLLTRNLLVRLPTKEGDVHEPVQVGLFAAIRTSS